MNAQDAYKTAYEANTNTINSQYSEIQKKIIDTAKKGEYTIYWYEYILPDVKKKLQNLHVIFIQHALEMIDLIVAPRPHIFRRQIVDAHYQHVLVMGAVENPNIADRRNGLVNAP